MDTPSSLAPAFKVLAAPGWVRVGIAALSERTREAAALERGALIAGRIEQPAATRVKVKSRWRCKPSRGSHGSGPTDFM